MESESSLESNYLFNTFGIDPERFYYLEHDRKNAAEGILDALESVIGTGAVDMVVINSLKCLVPRDEMGKSIGDNIVAMQARMNARLMRKITALVAEYNVAFVIVTHLSTEIGNTMSRDPYNIAGGQAIRYASVLTVDLRKKSIQESDPISRDEGMKIAVTVKKNHCVPDRNPYLKTEYFVEYGKGVEQNLSLLKKCIDQEVLIQKGSWIREVDSKGEVVEFNGQKCNWQGKAAFKAYIESSPSYKDYLLSKIDGLAESQTKEEIDRSSEDEESTKAYVESIIDAMDEEKSVS